MKVITNKQVKNQYKRVVDNKARVYGDTDLSKKIIRVNKKRSKQSGNKGEVLDTIVHEVHHAKHPMKHERTVRKDTERIIKHLNKKQKRHYYKLFA